MVLYTLIEMSRLYIISFQMYKIFLREYEIIRTNGEKYIQVAGFLFLGIDRVVDGCRSRKEGV